MNILWNKRFHSFVLRLSFVHGHTILKVVVAVMETVNNIYKEYNIKHSLFYILVLDETLKDGTSGYFIFYLCHIITKLHRNKGSDTYQALAIFSRHSHTHYLSPKVPINHIVSI